MTRHFRRLRATLVLALVNLLLVGACTDRLDRDEISGPPPFDPAPAYAAHDAVLRVEPVLEPDWATTMRNPPDHAWLPVLVVYGDGRVISREPGGGVVPTLTVWTIGADAAQALARQAIDAGVGWRSPDEPRAGYSPTRFTVLTDLGPRSSTLNTHFEMSTPERDRWMEDLLIRLRDLPAMLTGFTVSAPEPYEAPALLVVHRPWDSGDVIDEAERAWPGPAFPVRPDAWGLSCVAVIGEELDAVLTAAADATTATPWLADGQRYRVWLRPLLPGETSCALAG
jgi:hypothetical protein